MTSSVSDNTFSFAGIMSVESVSDRSSDDRAAALSSESVISELLPEPFHSEAKKFLKTVMSWFMVSLTDDTKEDVEEEEAVGFENVNIPEYFLSLQY